MFIIATKPEEEEKMRKYAAKIRSSGTGYNLYKNNCMHVAVKILNEGLKKRKDYQLKINRIRPDRAIEGFVEQKLKNTKFKKFIDDFYDPLIDEASNKINEVNNIIKSKMSTMKNNITNIINKW